jgi:hypothetical protein
MQYGFLVLALLFSVGAGAVVVGGDKKARIDYSKDFIKCGAYNIQYGRWDRGAEFFKAAEMIYDSVRGRDVFRKWIRGERGKKIFTKMRYDHESEFVGYLNSKKDRELNKCEALWVQVDKEYTLEDLWDLTYFPNKSADTDRKK